jgi:hypothetical protein
MVCTWLCKHAAERQASSQQPVTFTWSDRVEISISTRVYSDETGSLSFKDPWLLLHNSVRIFSGETTFVAKTLWERLHVSAIQKSKMRTRFL